MLPAESLQPVGIELAKGRIFNQRRDGTIGDSLSAQPDFICDLLNSDARRYYAVHQTMTSIE
jgi:hypothetical protein